jgi:hypothetical protein
VYVLPSMAPVLRVLLRLLLVMAAPRLINGSATAAAAVLIHQLAMPAPRVIPYQAPPVRLALVHLIQIAPPMLMVKKYAAVALVWMLTLLPLVAGPALVPAGQIVLPKAMQILFVVMVAAKIAVILIMILITAGLVTMSVLYPMVSKNLAAMDLVLIFIMMPLVAGPALVPAGQIALLKAMQMVSVVMTPVKILALLIVILLTAGLVTMSVLPRLMVKNHAAAGLVWMLTLLPLVAAPALVTARQIALLQAKSAVMLAV